MERWQVNDIKNFVNKPDNFGSKNFNDKYQNVSTIKLQVNRNVKRSFKIRKNINTEIFWNVRYAHLDVRKVIGGHHRKLYELVVDFIFNTKHNNIIDFGCGIGSIPYLLNKRKFQFENRRYVGVDFSAAGLKKIKKILSSFEIHKSRIDVLIREIDGLKYNSFDVALCIEVLEHLTDYRIALLNCRKFINKNGVVIISFPIIPIKIASHVRMCISIKEMEESLLAVGLQPFAVSTIDRWCIIKSKLFVNSDDIISDKKKIKIKLLSNLEIEDE